MSTPEPNREQRRHPPVHKLGHSVTDTAAMLDVTRPTIYKLIAEGRLRSKKLGSRRIVTTESINDLLND